MSEKTNPNIQPASDTPSGFQQSDTDVDNYPVWEFAAGPLIGEVMKVKHVELIRRGEAVDVRMAVITTADGELVLLWESANLENFFNDIKPGFQIHVVYKGEQGLGGTRKMKLYYAYYKA